MEDLSDMTKRMPERRGSRRGAPFMSLRQKRGAYSGRSSRYRSWGSRRWAEAFARRGLKLGETDKKLAKCEGGDDERA